jgi:cytochrome b involved in lipid metabolism
MSATANPSPATSNVRYYTPSEVELHNSTNDLWLSWLGNVYDLTALSQQRKGRIFEIVMAS